MNERVTQSTVCNTVPQVHAHMHTPHKPLFHSRSNVALVRALTCESRLPSCILSTRLWDQTQCRVWATAGTCSPRTVPTQRFLRDCRRSLRWLYGVLGFTVPGNLAAFLDDFEFTETQLDQTVSEAHTTTVSAYTSGDPKRRRIGKSSPLLPFPSPTLHSSSTPSSGVIASVTSIEDKMSMSGACLSLASKDT